MSQFKHPALKQLTDQQVRFAPPAKRQEQAARARRLMAEVDAGKQYPYQYICFRITDYRSDAYPDLLIDGADLQHDLAVLLHDLERSLDVPREQSAEPMLSLDELSKQLNVSTKTICRWRKQGLVGIQVVRDGRRQLGFPRTLVDQFVRSHTGLVQRGGRFSHLTESEKDDILRRARRLSEAGGSLTEVSRRIARKLGRSAEAVRYTIRNYDREHPEAALFPGVTGPLDGAAKQLIYNSFRRGVDVKTLAKRFGRNRSSMYRVINEVRAEKLLSQPVEYIYHESFDDPTRDAEYLAPMPDAERFEEQHWAAKAPKDVPPELAALYEYPLLSKDQEQHLFRKMNFLKHKLKKLQEQINPVAARRQDIEEYEELHRQSNEVKDRLIRCNMRLVASIAKRYANQSDNYFELISDGNMSLIRAVEKFDYSRGNKFSTYATWAIMKNFARSIPDEKHHRERYVTGHEDLFEISPDRRTDEAECLQSAEQNSQRVNRLLECLEPREREIIRLRAGLDNGEGMTLEEIGQRMGITKERVRQLNVRIMKKLRDMAQAQNLDMA